MHGFAQLLLTHTGRLPTLQSCPGPDRGPGAPGASPPPGGRGRHYHTVCLKCWFCSRWSTTTCTNSTFDSQRSNDGARVEIRQREKPFISPWCLNRTPTATLRPKWSNFMTFPKTLSQFAEFHESSSANTVEPGTDLSHGGNPLQFRSAAGKKCSHCSRRGYHLYLHCKHFITQGTRRVVTSDFI